MSRQRRGGRIEIGVVEQTEERGRIEIGVVEQTEERREDRDRGG